MSDAAREAELSAIAAEYADARRELSARLAERFDSDDDEPLAAALARARALLARWIAVRLEDQLDAGAEELVAHVEALDEQTVPTDDYGAHSTALAATVAPLAREPAAWVVAPNHPFAGTVFVISCSADGRCGMGFDIANLAREHFPLRDELGYWRYLGGGWGDGPLVGRVGALPPSASGRSRFYVDAAASALAGGTVRGQLSVWEWDGGTARPLGIEGYYTAPDDGEGEDGAEQEVDAPARDESAPGRAGFDGDALSVRTKRPLLALHSCGCCSRPRGRLTVRLLPEGAPSVEHVGLSPELEAADAVFDALLRNDPDPALAAPRVYDALRQMRAEAGLSGEEYAGMISTYLGKSTDDGAWLCLSLDNDMPPMKFEFERESGALRATEVRAADDCFAAASGSAPQP